MKLTDHIRVPKGMNNFNVIDYWKGTFFQDKHLFISSTGSKNKTDDYIVWFLTKMSYCCV